MKPGATLGEVLEAASGSLSENQASAALTGAIGHLAEAAATLSSLIASPPLDERLGAASGAANADGDGQRRLDLIAEDLFREALRRGGVAAYLSEEVEAPGLLDPDGVLAAAIDPLDGSSNIDVNAPIGTIFSFYPMVDDGRSDPAAAFRRTGRAQIAAGFFIYGPQTALVMTLGSGVCRLTLDRVTGVFRLVEAGLTIPLDVPEYAINASNYRHWRTPVQAYIDDCVRGADGPRGRNFNMRWIASLVADAYRIFQRGGIFLYPGDSRKDYAQGRLRLMYEANPIAFLAEQAGGRASDGVDAVLDRPPLAPHQRVPFVMGSADKVERVRRYHLDPAPPERDAPLFGRRGLLRS